MEIIGIIVFGVCAIEGALVGYYVYRHPSAPNSQEIPGKINSIDNECHDIRSPIRPIHQICNNGTYSKDNNEPKINPEKGGIFHTLFIHDSPPFKLVIRIIRRLATKCKQNRTMHKIPLYERGRLERVFLGLSKSRTERLRGAQFCTKIPLNPPLRKGETGKGIPQAFKKQNGASKRGAAPLLEHFPFPPGRG